MVFSLSVSLSVCLSAETITLVVTLQWMVVGFSYFTCITTVTTLLGKSVLHKHILFLMHLTGLGIYYILVIIICSINFTLVQILRYNPFTIFYLVLISQRQFQNDLFTCPIVLVVSLSSIQFYFVMQPDYLVCLFISIIQCYFNIIWMCISCDLVTLLLG